MEKFDIGGKEVVLYGDSTRTNANKFNRVNKIGDRYSAIVAKMKGIIEDKEANGQICSPEYSCAAGMLIILQTGIRVGNEDSAEGYNSGLTYGGHQGEFVQTYGLTTMEDRHVTIKGGYAYFSFLGKKQVRNVFVLPKDLSAYVVKIKECRRDTLFGITDYDLTKFIKQKISSIFSPKDFRTFRANVYAWEAIKKYDKVETAKEAKEIIKEVTTYVSQRLNNTPAVCKTAYINPLLFEEKLGYKP